MAVACVLAVWALTFFLFFITDSGERGQFGDMFGAVNALFSGLAFAGLIITLILQKTELGLQREELEQTREELRNQRVEFETQNETLKYQRFENLFYNMLNLQEKIVEGLRYSYETIEDVTVSLGDGGVRNDARHVEHIIVGRDLFRYAFDEMDISINVGGQYKTVNGFRRFLIVQGCSHYGDRWEPTLFDHYFRHLYRILKYIDTQGFTPEEAYKYTSLFRGTLSWYELVWIYYNSLCRENIKLRRLVEKYSILKNLRRELLTRSKEYNDLIRDKGFTLENLRAQGLYATDYDLYLTDRMDDPDYFFVGAFYGQTEIENGLTEVECFRRVLNS